MGQIPATREKLVWGRKVSGVSNKDDAFCTARAPALFWPFQDAQIATQQIVI